jgi:arylsulfatase A-like enzyme
MGHAMGRRDFLERVAAGAAVTACGAHAAEARTEGGASARQPNLVFVFGDQWRAQATGYAGDPNATTPHLDRLAAESVNFTHAVSGHPVCTPYRGSLLTGQYWLTHGLFVNDVPLRDDAVSFAEALNAAGYDTGYIGKWHVDGHGRSSFIPPERRQGFQFWRTQECTHAYNNSAYFGDENVPLKWEGYDAIAQTREAQRYLREHATGKPFALFLSWGPPHEPYETAPEQYRNLFTPERITLRPNVPAEQAEAARRELAGYYAHIAALDACIGDLAQTLSELKLDSDTVFVFTSDHGDMLHSQGAQKKQQPYDESIRVPFLLRYPARLGAQGKTLDTLLNTPDIMPTLLGLCGARIPETVEGRDFSGALLRGEMPQAEAALLMCPAPFGQWPRTRGGREYRGVRTRRYTYARGLDGPWLLFDNEADPYQQTNLCGRPEHAKLQTDLDRTLAALLKDTHDDFQPAQYYLDKWGYQTDKSGTVPYAP